MGVARLPEVLEPGKDLEALNAEVRSGGSSLDWTDVRQASDGALLTLLAGLDLVRDADILGIRTVDGDLADRVIAILLGLPGAPKPRPARRPAPARRDLPPSAPASSSGTVGPGDGVVLVPPSEEIIRDELQELVCRNLLGPAGGPEEEIDEGRVSDRYLVGLLAPVRRPVERDADDALAVAANGTNEDEAPEAETLGADTMFPSSLGLSCFVDGEAQELRVSARWGRYERVHSETLTTPSGAPKLVWKRVPVEGDVTIPLRDAPVMPQPIVDEYPEVVLQGVMRAREGGWAVTLFLRNEQREPKRHKDSAWLFQPELQVEDADGGPVFRTRPQHRPGGNGDSADYAEERAMAMLHRRHCEFAAGHGAAVRAEPAPEAPGRARCLRTEVLPSYDLPYTDSPTIGDLPTIADLVLDMKGLAELAEDDLLASLAVLPAAYEQWIGEQRTRLDDAAAGLQDHLPAAEAALAACERARGRITAGIDLLRENPQALESFSFMNRAMAMQRVRTLHAEAVRRHAGSSIEEVDVPANRSWRLFQLAFILLNLPGITELHHPERGPDIEATADLLWFPTGGGKTEAYLGLTAYTLGLRRLQGTVAGRSGEYGVGVLMRYTLRLLTLQQFQRAATLICACEIIRQNALFEGDTSWGVEPFRLGLWVGNRTTPGTTEDAAEAIKLGHGGYRPGAAVGSPAQLTNCPWCGTAIDPGRNIRVEAFGSGRGRTLIFCGDQMGQCPFSEKQADQEGLPVLVVDEEIYRLLPGLLISTVDKFARMPWKGETQMLFGQVSGRCERHGFRSPDLVDSDTHPARGSLPRARTLPHAPVRPPDLIIQDELHLISGPLGSLVGLYETAVDRLASWEVDGREVRPKVIASTATIRRAAEQVRAIFLRSVEVFPPHGLDVEDNFFSLQRPTSSIPGRRYVGICAPGKRLKASLIRVYVAYLAAAQLLFERYGGHVDPWMTLVGYFNSMRELGGMRRLVDDDVRSRLRRTHEHGLANRPPPAVEELTSRKGSTDIPYVLDRLERCFDPQEIADRRSRQRRGIRGIPTPLDVLLATNMVSVGVDVQRLGLMVVAGQPKTTAEYIQASSRVGRGHPGLICTVYNWTRPRDLSHYERFEHYHATFYQQVEALSVTPFSSRARDRALTALLVSLVRLPEAGLNGNAQAGKFEPDDQLVTEAVEAIVQRAWDVTQREEVRDLVRSELQSRIDEWTTRADDTTGGQQLGFQGRNDQVTVALLQSPDLSDWGSFTCLNSLRDVEPEVGLILDDHGLDDGPELMFEDNGPANGEGAPIGEPS